MPNSIPPNISPAPVRRFKVAMIATFTVSVAALGLSVVALIFALGLSKGGPDLLDFEKEVRAYLLANPEIIVEAVNQLEARQKETEVNELTGVIASAGDQIFNDPASPVGGNPEGDVSLVEFFDYNCPYCRKAEPVLAELAAGDRGLRIVFKEFPILGPGSEFAARQRLPAEVLRFQHLGLGLRHEIVDGLDAGVLEAVVGTDGQLEFVDRTIQLVQDPLVLG